MLTIGGAALGHTQERFGSGMHHSHSSPESQLSTEIFPQPKPVPSDQWKSLVTKPQNEHDKTSGEVFFKGALSRINGGVDRKV